MRNTLRKEGLLIVCLVLAFWTSAALGVTYTRPYGPSDYAGGAKAVGPEVNAEFQGITSFLNGQNIDCTNIVPGGVCNGAFGALSVNQNNIALGAVGAAQLATSNLVVSSSSSAFFNASGSGVPVAVTNLSASITVSGLRPLRVGLEPNPGLYVSSNNTVYFSEIYSSVAGVASVFILRGSSTTSLSYPGDNTHPEPCSALSYTETSLGAGTYTYSVYVGGQAGVYNCRLVLQEL